LPVCAPPVSSNIGNSLFLAGLADAVAGRQAGIVILGEQQTQLAKWPTPKACRVCVLLATRRKVRTSRDTY
jgi:hypothetical protein